MPKLIGSILSGWMLISLLVLSCNLSAATTGPGDASPASLASEEAPAEIPAGNYRLDRAHSTITFRISHLGFSWYTATFHRFDATLDFDPRSPENSSLEASVDVPSLLLPQPPEGFLTELLGPNWLNAGSFPEITYRSTRIVMTASDAGRMTGDLTMNARTAPVSMAVKFNGGYPGFPDLDPNARVGFSATGSLKRSDFGITLGIPEPGSSMGVGDEVTFTIETEFTGPALAKPPSTGGR